MNYMKKKILIVASIVGSLSFFYFVFAGYDSAAEAFQIFPVLFILVQVLHFFKKEVFDWWIVFTYIYIPVSIFLITLAPAYGSPFLKIEKDSVALLLDGLFILISFVIGWIYISRDGRRGERQK